MWWSKFLVVSLFTMLAAGAADARKQSFDCTGGKCTCNPNTTGDCDAMKKNCVGGQIFKCEGVGVVTCSCLHLKSNSAPDGTGMSKKPKSAEQAQ